MQTGMQRVVKGVSRYRESRDERSTTRQRAKCGGKGELEKMDSMQCKENFMQSNGQEAETGSLPALCGLPKLKQKEAHNLAR